ncbi:hypothetical protein BX616_000022 [Lobosporangium transversale]|uniref:DNA polymerase delta subunit 3 n=1 Tax=Lobosporangium transversale TaxID=64571 RepID=A0A1Y2GD49_9FUNG|nr:DNA polymerase subunit Cdc27 [Lobosporangium transversale]KAF9919411.1 hypothetical protein BX616_000022 [Lobosporangium transversale]ORZ04548.1 DNA polymerase subunit Cdc27 [Lobosporangium transversale]|eukprot:XP_021876594.1 DNA polymerase subunit Cdc27 [Lobosporangium transversale]
MTTDIENQTMELLTTIVEDEQKNVTYRWLSRSMGYSVNIAKQFMESYLATVGKGKVHASYYVARQDPQTGNRAISLISHKDLEDARNDTTVTGYHIYSLEPSPLKDLSILSVVNSEANILQSGKDISMYRIVYSDEASVPEPSKEALRSSASVSVVQSQKPSPSSSAASIAEQPLTGGPLTMRSTSKKATPAPTAGKSSMMNFFGKAGNSTPKLTTASTALSSTSSDSATNPIPQKRKADPLTVLNTYNDKSARDAVHGSNEEIDSEEERDRRLALSSRLDQSLKKSSTHLGEPPVDLDINALKKRQRSARLLAMDDDDEFEQEEDKKKSSLSTDEDDEESLEALSKEAREALEEEKEKHRLALEKMMLKESEPVENHRLEDEDSEMIDVEAMDEDNIGSSASSPRHVESKAALNQEPRTRRVRGFRMVVKRKTFRNERGYMVTEDVVEKEPYSEDEAIPEDIPAPAPVPAPAASKPPKSAGAVRGKNETLPKKKAGTGNQSLLNFFSKK